MRRGSFINVIIAVLIIVSGCILYLAVFSQNYVDDTSASIKISNSENIIKGDEQSSYTSEPLETAGSTILPSSTNSTFKGTKYYYNQLGEYSKIIYEAFENNIENLKTGNYKIQFNNEFNTLLKQSDGNDILNDEFQRAWDAFSYDRPDVFYLDPNKFSITVETSWRGLKTNYNVYISNGNNDTYLESGFSNKQQINNAINEMEELKEQFIDQLLAIDSDYDKVKALHDWIINNIEYDSSMSKVNRYNVYGALIDRVVVCEGYAKLFKYILDDIGIECVLVSGTAVNSEGNSERHMWNYVKLNEKWYAVDCTWDDPIVIGGGRVSNSVKYRYFLKGSSFNADHTEEPITEKSESLIYPKISSQDY